MPGSPFPFEWSWRASSPELRADDVGIANLNHFRLLRVVGKGAFGKVRIVEKKDTGLTFALKYIRKEEGMVLHRVGVGVVAMSANCLPVGSRPVGECPQHHSGAENARTPESPIPVQLEIQLSRY